MLTGVNPAPVLGRNRVSSFGVGLKTPEDLPTSKSS